MEDVGMGVNCVEKKRKQTEDKTKHNEKKEKEDLIYIYSNDGGGKGARGSVSVHYVMTPPVFSTSMMTSLHRVFYPFKTTM